MKQTIPQSIWFVGAAHLDRNGWAETTAQLQTSTPGQFEEFAGGASLNVASIFAKLDGKAKLATILGEDGSAAMIRQIAQARGIKLLAQTSLDTPTASYTSIINPNGDLVVALADMGIYDDFKAAPLLSKLTTDNWLCVDANLPASEIKQLTSTADCFVIALSVSSAKATRLQASLKNIDLLFTNRAEALAIVGAPAETETSTLVQGLKSLGLKQAVVSDGAEGVWVLGDGEITSLPVPALKSIIDVTGAGDALAGVSLYALAGGKSLVKSVEFGITAAQKIIQIRGPWRDDLAETL
ncbi:MAG: PfkB family carbohydrate kinase [Rhizobiaceae bacterium]